MANRMTARAFLAKEIRRARDAHGMNGMSRQALAKKILVSESLVAAWESGRQVPRAEHITALIAILKFGPDIVERLLEDLVSGEISPEWTGKWLAIEKKANTLLSYEHSVVPGLLQSEDYARTVLQRNQHSPTAVEAEVRARLERQQILDREDPPMTVFVLDEQVLRNGVDSAKTMNDQLLRLVELSERPNVIIQVIPRDTGYHLGRAGAFMIAKFDGMEVGYQDGVLRGEVLESQDDVYALSRTWMNIHKTALTEAASAELIARVAEEWTS